MPSYECTECPYVFTQAEIKLEDKHVWGHPCHGVKDKPNASCESFRKQFSQRPNVKRESLPDDGREKLILFCEDSPARPDYERPKGTTERDYLASMVLNDGRRLELHMGANACAQFIAMMAAMATDDAEEQL